MDTTQIVPLLLSYLDQQTLKCFRELSRWHMVGTAADKLSLLLIFREELVIELRTLAELHRERANRLELRAQELIRWFRRNEPDDTGAAIWL